jgi:diguanylate cyclase (GGDEF)-like protein
MRPADGPNRRLILLPAVLLLFMAALPWVSDYIIEAGGWSARVNQIVRGAFVSGLILLLGWWIITLIGREQRYTRHHLAELEQLTLTDPLTGLGNRRALERDLARSLRLSERIDEPVALLYMDVDHFKQINDRHGHAMGDETLRVLGSVLRSCSRVGTDAAYRVGGDEFVMALMADPDGAEVVAQRVSQEFLQRSPRRSNLSYGVVLWDGKASASTLLDQADGRMYQSKLGSGWARRRA